jgi:hypothetical protein
MALSKGAKIGIGCAVAALAAFAVAAAVVLGGAWWAKGKLESVAGNEEQIQKLHEKANRNRFEQPADGLIREDRLLTFLEARKRVYAVYEKYKGDIDARSKKKQADFGDVTASLGMLNELRLAQAQALADLNMSEDEYRYMVEQIYKTLWAAEVAKSTGGRTVSQAAGDMYDKAAQAMEQAARDAQQAEKQADSAGDEAGEETAEDTAKQARDQAREMREQAEKAREEARDLDVPPANIALFQKHEADIKRYAMSGLELMGL